MEPLAPKAPVPQEDRPTEEVVQPEPVEEQQVTEEVDETPAVAQEVVHSEPVEEQQVTEEVDDDDDDDLDDVLDMGDMAPPPAEVRKEIKDETKASVAFKWGFLGSGQGGGRLAQQFWQMGYRRVAAVNTAHSDIKPLKLPDSNKLQIGTGGGAGGDLAAGEAAAQENREEVFDLISNCFGEDLDRIFVTVTAGGGTGAGSVFEMIDICGDLLDQLELRDRTKDPKVGVIVARPKDSDGKGACRNAFITIKKLMKLTPSVISPLIIIDNQRIGKLYPDLSVDESWDKSNDSICSILNLLNIVSARTSKYTPLDKSDFDTILQSGLLAFGQMPVPNWEEPDGIGAAIRNNLKRNVLVSGLDFSTGTVAGCVMIASKGVMKKIKQRTLDDGFAMLGRMLKGDSPVPRGIYTGSNPIPYVYTMIGGLAEPAERLKTLQRLGCVDDWDDA
jgi:cell division GTPase FtsZ